MIPIATLFILTLTLIEAAGDNDYRKLPSVKVDEHLSGKLFFSDYNKRFSLILLGISHSLIELVV